MEAHGQRQRVEQNLTGIEYLEITVFLPVPSLEVQRYNYEQNGEWGGSFVN